MFKGLKSKLEDEAKRLQATVTQYGENIAQQVRTGASENGSDISGYTRLLFAPTESTKSTRKASQQSVATTATNVHASLPTDTIISLDDDIPMDNVSTPTNPTSSALLLQDLEDIDFSEASGTTRVRRLSNTSLESNESMFSTLTIPQSSNADALRLESISSDVESGTGSIAESASFESASREQLSSILHKLQGRAADYRHKYREVARAYRDLVRENEKCRNVLANTQDKALQRVAKLKTEKRELAERIQDLEKNQDLEVNSAMHESKIQKLQGLLEKCRERLAANKTQIASLTDENATLKLQLDNSCVVDLDSSSAIERVTAEWKGRVDRLEEEWSQRLSTCDEKAIIAIATSKAEMHATLQQKDQEIEKWIVKCHALEKQDADGNQRWQAKVQELNELIVNLESEKADMIEKLSKAKQEGVKLVKEEEEKKREQMSADHAKKLTIELLKKDDEWRKKFSEFEEQMQLAIEEREMQKAAALSAQEKRFEELNVQLETSRTENIRLKSELENVVQQRDVNSKSADFSSDGPIKNLEKRINDLIAQNENYSKQCDELTTKNEALNVFVDEANAKLDELRSHLRELSNEKESIIKADLAKIGALESQLDEVSKELNTLKEQNSILNEETAELNKKEAESAQLLEKFSADYRSKLGAFSAEKTMLEKRIGDLNVENQRLRKREDELEAASNGASQQISECNAKAAELGQKLIELNADRNSTVERKDADIRELKLKLEKTAKEQSSLRQKVELLSQQNKQLAKRRDELEAMCEERPCFNQSEKDRINVLAEENAQLLTRCAELEMFCEMSKPTELEYLRNVLYRYITERETLGKEIVTLTRVIGTVVKFTTGQLELAVKKEENRVNNQGWYGDMPNNNRNKEAVLRRTIAEKIDGVYPAQSKKIKLLPVTNLSFPRKSK